MNNINYKKGDLVKEVISGIIIHQVNAQGVMGSGIAKQLRDKYPVIFDDYIRVVGPEKNNGFGKNSVGKCISTNIDDDLKIVSIVSQQFYGNTPGKRYTSYDAIADCLSTIAYAIRCEDDYAESDKEPYKEIHLPMIGSGLGGANWNIVEAIIKESFATTDCSVNVWVLK